MWRFKLVYIIISSGILFLIACAPLNLQKAYFSQSEKLEDEVTINSYSDFENILNKAGCQNFRSYVWNYVYKIVSLEKGKLPPYYKVRKSIIEKIKEVLKHQSVSSEVVNDFATRFVQIYALVTEFMDQKTEKEIAETLVQFELGIIEPEHTEFVTQLHSAFLSLEEYGKVLNTACHEESVVEKKQYEIKDQLEETSKIPQQSNTLQEEPSFPSENMNEWDIRWFYTMRKTLHPMVYGALKVMATAYQSCSVLDFPLMTTDFNVKGVVRHSRHPSGNGWKRSISNLSALNNSHYYLKQLSIPNTRQCFNIYKSPLIYDFGGKPATTLNTINLFKNSGSGASILGIDCSGFVASAMAVAGLRLKPGMFIRPIHVKGINSWTFKTADRHNLTCLQKQIITAQNPLKPGDIIASSTHIFIVEMTSADPFNLRSVNSSKKCHSQNGIKTSDFKFSVIQSSSHNSGVGINRMHIQEALGNMSSMIRGLKKTASRACYKMYGQNYHNQINEISILRHANHAPSCVGREIYLENQECLKDCTPQYL